MQQEAHASKEPTLQTLQAWNVSLIALNGMQFDLTTPQGRLIASLMASLAEFECDLIRERVRSVMAELGGEKIDIVDYSDDPARFVANSLSPARVTRVVVHSVDNRTATAIVPDFQLSLAIGKEGQNARLAARLTNYHIDIHADTETGDDEIASRVSTPDDVTSRS